MTWKEIVYLVSDELKLDSDDSTFNENHIVFLLSKYRAFILNQRYKEIRKQVSSSNYQTICLDVEQITPEFDSSDNTYYLKSIVKVPGILGIGNIRIFSKDYFNAEITYITKDRMRYVGYNKYMNNIIYCTKDANEYLYFKSYNPRTLDLKNVKMNAVFEDIEDASELECEKECDLMDRIFPMEDSLIPAVVELVVKELLGASYRPEDSENNASDDIANLASFIQRNAKSSLAKQVTD